MSDLVGNPEDRFSRVEAQMIETFSTVPFIIEVDSENKCAEIIF